MDIIKRMEDDLVNRYVSIFGDTLKVMILYGSYARGDYTEESDFDILLLVDFPRDKIDSLNDINAETSCMFTLDYGIVISPIIENESFFNEYADVSPFFMNVQKDGIRLYG